MGVGVFYRTNPPTHKKKKINGWSGAPKQGKTLRKTDQQQIVFGKKALVPFLAGFVLSINTKFVGFMCRRVLGID